MAITHEHVTERVDLLIESIRHGLSYTLAEHHAALTIDYIVHVYDLGIINGAQFDALVIAVNEAADDWRPLIDSEPTCGTSNASQRMTQVNKADKTLQVPQGRQIVTDVDYRKLAACAHHVIRKGYCLGLEADLYICVACGEKRLPQHWEHFELRRAPPHGMLACPGSQKP